MSFIHSIKVKQKQTLTPLEIQCYTSDTYFFNNLLFEEITLHCITAVQRAKTYSLKLTKDVFFPFNVTAKYEG